MGDEPTLYEGDHGVNGWVKELQRALLDAGYDPQGIDGKFQWRTAKAVVAFQRAKRLKVDSRAGNQTWAALRGRAPEPPGVNNKPFGEMYVEEPAATPDTTPATPTTPPAGDQLQPDGQPTEPGGYLPTYRLNVPDWAQVHKQTFDLGVYLLEVTLTLGGGFLQIGPPPGATIVSVDQDGYRGEIRSQLGDYFSGIRINGITGGLTQNPLSLGSVWGNEFHTMEVRYLSPTSYAHIGRATLAMDLPTSWGNAQVTGGFGYQVTFEIHLKAPPPVAEEKAWYETAWDFVDEHAGEILVGAVVVAAIIVVPEAAPGILRLAF